MSHFLPDSFTFLLLSLGFILLVLCGVITSTIRISFRLSKVESPKLKLLFAIALLQILLGGLTVFVLRSINDDPFIDIGSGAGITFLSGLFFLKLIFKKGWKRSLRVWAIAAAMQMILVPICSVIMVGGWMMFFFWLYPPQF